MSSQQGSASVHVVLRLKHVHHLVGVEFEHALHLHVLCVLFLSTVFRVLLLMLTSPLTLPDSPQISVGKERTGKKNVRCWGGRRLKLSESLENKARNIYSNRDRLNKSTTKKPTV